MMLPTDTRMAESILRLRQAIDLAHHLLQMGRVTEARNVLRDALAPVDLMEARA